MKQLRLGIEGHVQGVYYRESMRREAEARGVSGWVRNIADGSVEAVVAGDDAAVDGLVAWAFHGPEAATVVYVSMEADNEPVDDGFAVRATAAKRGE